jgi:hypothetical protein
MTVSVQSGRASVGGTASTIDVTISAVDTSNTWLRHSTDLDSSHASSRFDFTAELINSTTIRFTRGLGNVAAAIEWFAITDSNATVQRGTISFSTSENNKTATISAVDLTKSFIAITSRSGTGSTNINVSMFSAEFDNSTTIRCIRQNTATECVVSYEVVTISDAVVQSGFRTLSGSTQSAESLSTVSLANTFAIISNSAASNVVGRALVCADFTTSSTLRLQKGVGTSAVGIGWFVVSCPRYSVQLADSGYVTTQTVNTSISSVDLSKTFLVGTARASTTSTSSTNSRSQWFLSSATNVRRVRANTSGNYQNLVFAIEMEEGGDPAIEATLAVTEQGNDAASASANVAVSATITASEVGFDTASASVAVDVTGSAAAQEEGSDQSAINVGVGVAGSFAVTEQGQDNFSASAGVNVGVTADLQEIGNDDVEASATVAVAVDVDAIELELDDAAISATVDVSGAVDVVETGNDASDIDAAVSVNAALAVNETANDIAEITAGVGVDAVTDVAEQGNDTAAIAANVLVAVILDAQEEGDDIAAITATVSVDAILATLAAVESGNDTASASVSVAVASQLVAQEAGNDTFDAIITVANGVVVNALETGNDTLDATADVAVSALLNVAEQKNDSFEGYINVSVGLSLDAVEIGNDIANIVFFDPQQIIPQLISNFGQRNNVSVDGMRAKITIIGTRNIIGDL